MTHESEAGERKCLFLDLRHIQCGALSWLTAAGQRYGVANPPGEPVPMHARPVCVPHGVRLVARPAKKAGTMADYRGWGRVINDGGRYRSWFLEVNGHSKLGTGSAAHARAPESVAICSVESDDGYRWSEPQRCPIEVPGQWGMDGVTFFIDPHAPAQERYKFVYCARFGSDMHEEHVRRYLSLPARWRDERITHRARYGMFAAVSPDGQSWRALPQPIMLHPSDTDTTVLWDESLGRYVMYTRMVREGRRWIGRAETEDFCRWGPVEPVVWPRLDDPLDYDFYLNGYTRYPGLPAYQLMFPMVYHRYTERSEVRLYSSADGIAWNQVPGGPVLEPGEPGEWDCEFIGSGKDLVPFGADRVAIPYSGTCYPHKYPRWQPVWDAWQMGWAWWPRDRICALRADYEGEFCVELALPPRCEIRLNCRTAMAGEVRVGILGVEGRSTLDCVPVVGDHPAAVVRWRDGGYAGPSDGQRAVLHFQMRAAELYAISWT